jgi:PTS system nitrogen regulatory IIA component
MNIGQLLAPERVSRTGEISSKKRVLETLSEMLSTSQPDLSSGEIFDSLISRERLGSTGLGHGVAIPHGRVAGVKNAVAALIKLERGVDFDAPDREPVDLLFALLVPQESTDEHLEILATLARMFADPSTLASLRSADDGDALLDQVRHWDSNGDSAAP